MATRSSARRRTRSAFQRHRRLGAWRERFVLPNGREVVLRPIEPADARALRDGFALLTAEEVRMRFLYPLKELSPELTFMLTHVDGVNSFALVVAEPLPPGDALVGAVVRASRHAEGGMEFAILVARPLARQGLGTYLLTKLLRWCRRQGATSVWGDVLNENEAMLHLAGKLGFRREHQHGDQGLVRIIREFPRARVKAKAKPKAKPKPKTKAKPKPKTKATPNPKPMRRRPGARR